MSRHAKKITAGICRIFRGLSFEHNTEIVQKDYLWMDTNSAILMPTCSQATLFLVSTLFPASNVLLHPL